MRTRLRRANHPADEGFTLVELLTVIVILGILAAIALPAFLGQKSKAQRATLLSDLRSVSSAQEAYFVDNGTYASDESALAAEGFARSSGVSNLQITVYVTAGSAAYCAMASHTATGVVAWFSSTAGRVSETSPDVSNCPS